jgi:hypothetical protein
MQWQGVKKAIEKCRQKTDIGELPLQGEGSMGC